MKRYLYILLLATTLVGCLNNGEIDNIGHNPMEVRLWADVGYSPNISYGPRSVTRGTATSTSGIVDATTDTTLFIGMARVNEAERSSYPGFLNRGVIINAEMGAPVPSNSYIRNIKFTESLPQFFPNATDSVKYVAWAPWKDEEGYDYESDENSTRVTIPITGDSDIMYANVVTGTKNSGFNVMKFDHALCIYRIYVYSMSDEDNSDSSSWGALDDLQIEDLPTSCVLTLPDKENNKIGIAYEGNGTIDIANADNNIYFSPGDKIPAGLANRRMVAKCIAAPPQDSLLHISLGTSLADVAHKVSIARNFKPGYAYDVVLRFSNHGFINADVSVGEWNRFEEEIKRDVEVDMFFNLSNYETANSYIVNSANYGYCFDGTVRGNGENIVTRAVNTKIEPKYIDILWDDTPLIEVNGEMRKAVELKSHELTLGRVLFHVYGNSQDQNDKKLTTEGNVIIAAYDEEGGNILWTWHIWLTDRVRTQGYPNGYIVHDRNLGATSADGEKGTMEGLYYQWGRPTPFRKASSGIYGNVNTVPSISTQAASIDEAIAQPTKLFGSGDNTTHNWLATQINGLWGFEDEHIDLKKTMYDPCPPGYQVADTRVWQNISRYEMSNGWQASKGVHLSVASNDVWYPFQGYINADGSSVEVNASRIWSGFIDWRSSNVSNSSSNPYELQYTASNSSNFTAQDTYRNRALPVRCVSKHSTHIVTDLSASQTANCYMVHRAGYYKFKATVRGNGVGSLLPIGGTTTWDITDGMSINIKPAKVDFLWWQGDFETSSNTSTNYIPMEIMNNGEIDDDGYFYFHVNEWSKGNVGLAAYDAYGEILWSWHIWFTDKPEDKLTGDYTTMDRFVGATYAPTISSSATKITFANDNQLLATYGFYYQWGRKDPFFGPATINAGTPNNVNCSEYWLKSYNGGWSKKSNFDVQSQVRIPISAQNPLVFYKGSAEKDSNSSWMDPAWCDGGVNTAMWGYAVINYSLGQSFTKTIHDPCPPGYQTMFYLAWNYNDKGYTKSAQGSLANNTNEGNFHDRGVVFTKTGFDRAWFPFVGRRNGTNGRVTNVGSQGYTSTGTPMSSINTRTYYYNKTNVGQDRGIYGYSTAMPVRCQKQ